MYTHQVFCGDMVTLVSALNPSCPESHKSKTEDVRFDDYNLRMLHVL